MSVPGFSLEESFMDVSGMGYGYLEDLDMCTPGRLEKPKGIEERQDPVQSNSFDSPSIQDLEPLEPIPAVQLKPIKKENYITDAGMGEPVLSTAQLKKPPLRGYGKKTTTNFTEDNPVNTSRYHTFMPAKLLPPQQIAVLSAAKKKRRLLVDTLKVIPNAQFKKQMEDTADVIGRNDFAPSTKRDMHLLTYGSVGKFFAYPGRELLSGPLSQLFFSHLILRTEITPTQEGDLDPLDSELKTPLGCRAMVSSAFELTAESLQFPQCFSELQAKRTAGLFDHIVKGFSGYRHKRRRRYKGTYRDHSNHASPSSCEVGTQFNISDEINTADTQLLVPSSITWSASTQQGNQELINSDSIENGSPVECPDNIDQGDVEMVEKDTDISDSGYINGDNELEGVLNSQQKLGILMGTSSHAESAQAGGGSSSIELSGVEGGVELIDEGGKHIIYCTAENDSEGGEFVIVDSSGKRYTISAATTGVSVWPHTPKAID